MSAPLIGLARFPVAIANGKPESVGLHPLDSGVLVHIVGSDVAGVVADWPFSGTLVGAAGAVLGYASNVPNALSPTHVGFPRGQGSTKIRLSTNVEVGENTFTVAASTITVWRFTGGVWAATIATFTYAFGVVGIQQGTFAVAFADGDLLDLRVDNPGNVGDVGKIFGFGASVVFLLS